MSDKHSRTERASAKKREKARGDGQVFRSREAAGAFAFLLTVAGFLAIRARVGTSLGRTMEFYFNAPAWLEDTPIRIERLCMDAARDGFLMSSPLMALAITASIAGNVLQSRPTFTAKPFAPNPSRLFSTKKLTQAFSLTGVSNLVRGVLGLSALTLAGWSVLSPQISAFGRLPELETLALTYWVSGLVTQLLIRAVLIFAVIGAIDYVLSYRQHEDSMKMTKQEVKEEHKQIEGSPEIKLRIRKAQRAMARQRMMAMVPQATVVVTNPTHVAVALYYNPVESPAPQVVAKGKGELAQRIREIARQHSVPIHEDPPLARALYPVELGVTIPAELFTAVAEVLAYLVRSTGLRLQ